MKASTSILIHTNLIFLLDPLPIVPDLSQTSICSILRWAFRLSALKNVCYYKTWKNNGWAYLLSHWSVSALLCHLVHVLTWLCVNIVHLFCFWLTVKTNHFQYMIFSILIRQPYNAWQYSEGCWHVHLDPKEQQHTTPIFYLPIPFLTIILV